MADSNITDYANLDLQDVLSRIKKNKLLKIKQLKDIEKFLKKLKSLDYSNPEHIKYIQKKSKLEEWLMTCENAEALAKDIKEAQQLIKNGNTEAEMQSLAQQILHESVPQFNELSTELLSTGHKFDNFILEIRAGAGGQEAALFARDLFRMYTLFFETMNITYELTDVSQNEIGGYKHISAYIKGKGAYEWVKYETGVHRVQRVPVTESGGRIHTSTASVAILPDIDTEDIDIKIDPKDLEIERIRASGPGGQFVNKVETAIRIKHIPTGIIVVSQQSKSQTANKEYAMKILRSKLYQAEQEKRRAELSKTRKSQIGTQDRSEKIRTYNYPQNRVTDHRIKKSWYNLDQIMNGKIEDLLTTVRAELDKIELEEQNE